MAAPSDTTWNSHKSSFHAVLRELSICMKTGQPNREHPKQDAYTHRLACGAPRAVAARSARECSDSWDFTQMDNSYISRALS